MGQCQSGSKKDVCLDPADKESHSGKSSYNTPTISTELYEKLQDIPESMEEEEKEEIQDDLLTDHSSWAHMETTSAHCKETWNGLRGGNCSLSSTQDSSMNDYWEYSSDDDEEVSRPQPFVRKIRRLSIEPSLADEFEKCLTGICDDDQDCSMRLDEL